MTVRVTIRENTAELRRLLTSPQAGVARDIFRRGQRVRSAAVRLCRVDTGRLRSSITVELVVRDGRPAARVGTVVSYARYVHDGTGIYGPRGAPITPRAGRYLVFTPRGAAGPVFARSVRGSSGTPFLRMALDAAR